MTGVELEGVWPTFSECKAIYPNSIVYDGTKPVIARERTILIDLVRRHAVVV